MVSKSVRQESSRGRSRSTAARVAGGDAQIAAPRRTETGVGADTFQRFCPVCVGHTLTGVVRFAGTSVGFCPGCQSGVVVEVQPKACQEERAKACHEELAEDYSTRYESELLDAKALTCWDIVRREMCGRLDSKRLLDIGCGQGAFLDVARRAGLRTAGVEIATRAADATEAKGHQVFRRSAEESFCRSDERFDIITMWDILEHLGRPRLALGNAYGRLSEGGQLFILTTMMGSPYDRCGRRVHGLTVG